MAIEKTPFRRYKLEKEGEHIVISVKLNEEEQKILQRCKTVLRQPKDSTAIKQLAKIGAKVILGQETAEILDIVFENDRKNSRLGVVLE